MGVRDATAITLAEILYRARGAADGIRRSTPAAAALSAIADLAEIELRNMGEDPGVSAEHADLLKLDLLKREPAAPPLDASLEAVAESSGCDGLSHRVVGRFSEFVQRAVFGSRGEHAGIIEDDPWLPVAPWIRERGHDVGDLRAAGVAFLEWTKAADAEFSGRRAGRVGQEAGAEKPPPFRLGGRQ